VIELIGLEAQTETRASKLSGGQQRRLDVGMALIGDPELLFLDEPTTGFDPKARRQAWEAISSLRELGKTVFLTTHYMDEAQRLADRVAIIAGGRIVASGTPDTLGARGAGATTIRFALPAGSQLPPVAGAIGADDGNGVSIATEDPTRALHALTGWALEHGVTLDRLEVQRPSLEDAYLALTGDDEARS
jgi:ABC-2 type transport system ATP-binding protein